MVGVPVGRQAARGESVHDPCSHENVQWSRCDGCVTHVDDDGDQERCGHEYGDERHDPRSTSRGGRPGRRMTPEQRPSLWGTQRHGDNEENTRCSTAHPRSHGPPKVREEKWRLT